jgi:hypothetical protein
VQACTWANVGTWLTVFDVAQRLADGGVEPVGGHHGGQRRGRARGGLPGPEVGLVVVVGGVALVLRLDGGDRDRVGLSPYLGVVDRRPFGVRRPRLWGPCGYRGLRRDCLRGRVPLWRQLRLDLVGDGKHLAARGHAPASVHLQAARQWLLGSDYLGLGRLNEAARLWVEVQPLPLGDLACPGKGLVAASSWRNHLARRVLDPRSDRHNSSWRRPRWRGWTSNGNWRRRS